MRVFLDTNVLVSAFATRGLCAELLRTILAEHQLVLGEAVLTELGRVLATKMKVPSQTVAETDAFLRQEAAVISHSQDLDLDIRDPDDIVVVAQAIEGLADVLITGDRDLLDIAEALPLNVLSPRDGWELLQRRGKPGAS